MKNLFVRILKLGLYHSSDNVVCLWKLGEGGGAGNNIAMDMTPNEENWTVTKMLRYLFNILDFLHFNPLITGATSKISMMHVGQLTPVS